MIDRLSRTEPDYHRIGSWSHKPFAASAAAYLAGGTVNVTEPMTLTLSRDNK